MLPDVLAVANAWPTNEPHCWVASPAADTASRLEDLDVHWVEEPTMRSMPGRAAAAARHLDRLDPSWVVSAGTAIALPYFVAAKMRRTPSLWIETLNIHGAQGRVARLCSTLAESTAVQRRDRLDAHTRAFLVGELQ